MTDERTPQPPAVKSYAGGIAARTAARQEERRQNSTFPNLGAAAMTYRPEQGPQTLEDIGRAQRADAGDGKSSERASLSPETVEGLRALRAAQETATRKETAAAPVAPPAAAPAQAEEAREPAEDEPLDAEDYAFSEALEKARRDVIQNDFERRAVAKRVKEIDLAEGLLTGEFTQVVPIVPGKLDVKFRCLTVGENNDLRLLLFNEVEADPRKGRLVQELLGFYQTVATVVSINNTVFAKHMAPSGPFNQLTFQPKIFEQKVAEFMAFPLPLISSLGTHSTWFEQRVRQLFATADVLKNG